MKIIKIVSLLIPILLACLLIEAFHPMQVDAKNKSIEITADCYDTFWTKFYDLMAQGYTSIKITITGDDAEKVKAAIDDSHPYIADLDLVSTYVNDSNWKAKYLVDFFYHAGYYEVPQEYYDYTTVKDNFFEWHGKNYFNLDVDSDWIESQFIADYTRYLWDEESHSLVYATVLNSDGLSSSGVEYSNVLKSFNKIEKLLKSWNLEKMTDYQRIEKVCKYICKTVRYGKSEDFDPHSGTDTLLNGVGVCGGYAELTDYFLKTMGYQSAYLSGYTKKMWWVKLGT